MVRYLGRLDNVADALGVPHLDAFVVYRQELVLEALHAAGWETVGAKEMGTIIDNIGVPYSGLNLSYSNSAPVGDSGT